MPGTKEIHLLWYAVTGNCIWLLPARLSIDYYIFFCYHYNKKIKRLQDFTGFKNPERLIEIVDKESTKKRFKRIFPIEGYVMNHSLFNHLLYIDPGTGGFFFGNHIPILIGIIKPFFGLIAIFLKNIGGINTY